MSDVEGCTCETETVGSHPTEVVAVQALCCNRDMNPSSNGIGDKYAGETDPLKLNHAFTRSPGNARLFANRHCYRCGAISAEDAAEEELRGKDVSINCTLVELGSALDMGFCPRDGRHFGCARSEKVVYRHPWNQLISRGTFATARIKERLL